MYEWRTYLMWQTVHNNLLTAKESPVQTYFFILLIKKQNDTRQKSNFIILTFSHPVLIDFDFLLVPLSLWCAKAWRLTQLLLLLLLLRTALLSGRKADDTGGGAGFKRRESADPLRPPHPTVLPTAKPGWKKASHRIWHIKVWLQIPWGGEQGGRGGGRGECRRTESRLNTRVAEELWAGKRNVCDFTL